MLKRRLSRVFMTTKCPRKIVCFFWSIRHDVINSARVKQQAPAAWQ
jgi:hypothetical protein